MSSPEDTHTLGISGRPGLKEVEQSVQAFSLHSGPADVPAFHDFHHVGLAFESIWTELFDGEVEGLGEQLYESLVEAGVDPNAISSCRARRSISSVRKVNPRRRRSTNMLPMSSRGCSTSHPSSGARCWPRASGSNWRSLPATSTRFVWPPWTSEVELFGVKIARPLCEGEIQDRDKMVRFLREQGNRMIRYADNRVMRPQRFDQFHEVLGELTRR